MKNLFIFRGKAATGKSTITDLLSQELNICILRKDDIYDMLTGEDLTHSAKNKMSYDIMAKMINTNLKNNCALIIDIALANASHVNIFINKIDLQETNVKHFLCICSDEEKWKRRIEERIKNPTPNQIFKTANDAIKHYNGHGSTPRKDEIILDSSRELLDIIDKVKRVLETEL